MPVNGQMPPQHPGIYMQSSTQTAQQVAPSVPLSVQPIYRLPVAEQKFHNCQTSLRQRRIQEPELLVTNPNFLRSGRSLRSLLYSTWLPQTRALQAAHARRDELRALPRLEGFEGVAQVKEFFDSFEDATLGCTSQERTKLAKAKKAKIAAAQNKLNEKNNTFRFRTASSGGPTDFGLLS
ncbi:hypothetical protein L596_022794 [Steinernema carpocapsae]|uniref:Uncharacterized protein n=1 Tax=Steinernema carpocapsae TaxID=34508 RepID=A0A4U5MMT0_STECR|nr:hypothetical protein L596_022794 [Steinernema carpocapsae]